MKRRFFLLPGLVLTALIAAHPLPAQSIAEGPDKPKMVILPARVTVDGVARPDIGQSLSDIISARLLTSSALELLDADTPAPDPIPPAPSPAPASGVAPESMESSADATLFGGRNMEPWPNPVVTAPATAPASAPPPVTTGIALGADLVVQPTVVGSEDEFRLTLRKIEIPDGRLVAIITEKTSTGLKGLYALAEKHALRLAPVPPSPRPVNGGPAIIDHPARYVPPAPAEPVISEQELASAPPALEKLPPAKQAAINATMSLMDPASKRESPTAIGRIGGLDGAWSFCSISLKRPLEFPAGTVVFATAGGNPQNIVNLTVTRTEGRKMIADFVPGPTAAFLKPGDVVYYWQP